MHVRGCLQISDRGRHNKDEVTPVESNQRKLVIVLRSHAVELEQTGGVASKTSILLSQYLTITMRLHFDDFGSCELTGLVKQ